MTNAELLDQIAALIDSDRDLSWIERRASRRHTPMLEVHNTHGPGFTLRPTTARWDHVIEDQRRGEKQARTDVVGSVRAASRNDQRLMVTLPLDGLVELLTGP